MDKELAQLEDWAVNLINDYETVLQKKDPKSSQHKRIKRFSGELVANPEAYAELLDMARSKNMTAKELLQSIRSIESNLLDESSRGTSMSRKQLMSDVIHHFYAQRTGGDTLRKLSQPNRQQARTALRELFGPWGNVPENLKSLFRAGHLKSDALKGVEGLAVSDLGVTKAGEIDLPKAHTTVGKAVTGDIVGATTWQEAVEGMAPQMDIQRTEGLRAIKATQPLMDKLDTIAGSKYTGIESAEELAVRRNLFTAKSDEVGKAIREFYSPLVLKNGAMRLVPGIGKIGVGLTALGALGDAASATTGTYGAVTKTGKERTASGLNAASGLLGLASLAAPPLTAASVATGTVGMLAENRIERDKRRERDLDIKAGRIQPKRPDPYTTTITKREPSTLEKIASDPLNEFEYFGKQAFSFFGSAVRLASPLGF
jgi:hypothetical protein